MVYKAKNLGDANSDRETEQDVLRALDAEVASLIEAKPAPPDPNLCPLLLLEEPETSPEGAWLHVHIFDHGDVCEWIPRGFSSNIADAMRVVEKIGFDANESMRAINISVFSIHRYPDGQWLVHFSLKGKAYAETLPLAICRAALRASTNNG